MQNRKSLPVISVVRDITRICAAVIIVCAVAENLSAADPAAELPVLVEAEGFADPGGWVVDPQFMDLMGSPYLLAHGLGVPVNDAKTEVAIPKAGRYRVWLRTKDWVAQWSAPGTPGRFQVIIMESASKPPSGPLERNGTGRTEERSICQRDNSALHSMT